MQVMTSKGFNPNHRRFLFWPRFGQISLRVVGSYGVSIYWRSRPRWIDRVFPGWQKVPQKQRG